VSGTKIYLRDTVIEIVYPSGSHGQFLSFLLNSLYGVKNNYTNNINYDKIKFTKPVISSANHCIRESTSKIIHISVDPTSYLKYISMCIGRTAGYHIDINDIDNIGPKLENHITINSLVKKITAYTPGDLREWAQLTLFADNGKTISLMLKDTVPPSIDYTFNFEWFYNIETLVDKCHDICQIFGIEVKQSINQLVEQFYYNNNNKDINVMPNKIINAIENRKNLDFGNLNFLQEAWINNWLVDTYKVVPLLTDAYFTNTSDIIKQYKL
jgi:hypothetical protein